MKRRILIKVMSGVIFLALPAAAELSETEWTRGRAQAEALSNFEKVRNWVSNDGDLKGQLEKCTSSNSFFDPITPVPAKDSPTVKKLCDLLFSQENIGEVTEYAETCEYVKYTPCEFEFEKKVNFQFTVEARVDISNFFYPERSLVAFQQYPAHEETFVVIHCELVAVLGLEPRWICGGGFDMTWYVRDYTEVSAQTTKWFKFRSFYSGPGAVYAYSRVRDSNFLINFLEVSDVLKR